MPSEKKIEEQAKKAADALGVTPYSDMRIFVEQAVIYALTAAEQAEPAPAARSGAV